MTTKRKVYIIVSWILVFACMGVIFYMSSRPATESQAMSDGLLKKIMDLFHIEISSFIIRKGAHLTEFLGLALLLFNSIYATSETKFTPYIAWGVTFLYAVSDEIHQIFVDGRACQFRDMAIDGTGALIGVLIGFIILIIYKKIKKRGNENGDIKSI